MAASHGVCPYYLGQELARWADLVIGDYNHFFDLSAMLHALTQINGWRGETDTHEKIQKRVEHDLYYIENWSLAFDVKILFRTFFARENAY